MLSYKEYVTELKVTVPKKSDTLGIQRDKMPQVSSADMPDYLRFLKTKNVGITKKNVKANTLKATQSQFDKTKIVAHMTKHSEVPNVKPILISKDNYVIDGHHRWLAVLNGGGEMIVYQANVNAKELISVTKEFPKTFYKTINEELSDVLVSEELIEECDDLCESDTSCPIVSVTAMKQFEGIVDKLFAKYKIDFNFTRHFRERMGDKRNSPCINIKELATMLAKLYAKTKQGKESLSNYKDTEVVLKDIQSHLNMPIALEYDRKSDNLNVISKTIMRKKNFMSPDKTVKV